MKIRNGFVSNSSSSSFCMYGVKLEESILLEKIANTNKKNQLELMKYFEVFTDNKIDSRFEHKLKILLENRDEELVSIFMNLIPKRKNGGLITFEIIRHKEGSNFYLGFEELYEGFSIETSDRGKKYKRIFAAREDNFTNLSQIEKQVHKFLSKFGFEASEIRLESLKVEDAIEGDKEYTFVVRKCDGEDSLIREVEEIKKEIDCLSDKKDLMIYLLDKDSVVRSLAEERLKELEFK